MSDTSAAIPGVRCGKCLGRIDQHAIDTHRKIHEKLRPGVPYVGPRLCSECAWRAMLNLAASVDHEPEWQGE